MEIFLGNFFTDVFTAQPVPKKRSLRNAAASGLPLVVDLGCGYIYVTG